MERFNYYFNTRARIDSALSVDINKATMPSILFNLIWDAYYNVSKNEDDIVKYIVNWMESRTNIFHLSSYAKVIKNNIKQMKDMPWRDIQDTVKVRKSELDYIASFNDIKKEKLLFCYLAIAKFNDMSRKSPTHWENESDITVFKMARLNIPASERDYFIYDLINGIPKAAIYLNFKNDDTSKRIDYISDDDNDPVVIELDETNYYELAFTYLNWKNNGGYKKCKCCGKLFRVRGSSIGKQQDINNAKNNNSLYCNDCANKSAPLYKGKDTRALDYVPKKIQCIDCGDVVYIDNYKNNTTCRCLDCQYEANKLAKREWKRKHDDKQQ